MKLSAEGLLNVGISFFVFIVVIVLLYKIARMNRPVLLLFFVLSLFGGTFALAKYTGIKNITDLFPKEAKQEFTLIENKNKNSLIKDPQPNEKSERVFREIERKEDNS